MEGSTVPFSKGVLSMLCCAVVGRSHSQSGEQTQVMPFEYDAEHAVLCCAVLCCAVLCCAVLCCAVQVTQPAYFESDDEHAVLCCGVQVIQPAW